jgi:hypothetical protein
MTDAIIKFPSAVKPTKTENKAAEFKAKFDSVINQEAPESTQKVQIADTLDVISLPKGLRPVHDFETAGKRNPKWGVTLSFSIMPELNRAPVGPIMVPHSQNQFFAADDLDQIKERIFFEIEKSVQLARLAAEDPEGYQAYEVAAMQERISSLRELEESDGN